MGEVLASVIIVNYNGEELLDKAINSILKSTFKNFEIIIVDNASTDGSQEFIKKKYPKIKLVENKINLGYSGINNAIKHCRGKYILFLNNDIEVDRKCTGNLIKVIASDKSIGMTAPRLINYYNRKLVSGGTWLSRSFYSGHIKDGNVTKNSIIPYLGIGLIRKSIVDKYGYIFDPDYFIYGEDVDLGLRIRLLGMKVVFVSNAIIYHVHAATIAKKGNVLAAYLMERNLLTTFFKILSVKNIILSLPYVLFMRLIAIVKDIITLNIDLALLRIKAILNILVNLNTIVKKRRQTQKFRKVNDDYIFEVFSEKYLFKSKFIV